MGIYIYGPSEPSAKKLLNLDQNKLTENLASTPDISQLINSVELFIFIPRVVDNREGIRWLKKIQRKNSHGDSNKLHPQGIAWR